LLLEVFNDSSLLLMSLLVILDDFLQLFNSVLQFMNLNLLIFALREEVVVGACKLGIVFHNLLLDFKCSFLLLFSLILNLCEII